MTELDERQRIERARRAAEAIEEHLDPAFLRVREGYEARMREVVAREPWAVEKINALVIAQRVVEEVRKEIAIIVKDGEAARHELVRVETLATMSGARRRALGL